MNNLNNSFKSWMGTGSGLWTLLNASVTAASAMGAYHRDPFPSSLSLFYIASPILSYFAYNSNQALSKTKAPVALFQKNITALSSLAMAGLISLDVWRNPGKGLVNLAIKTAGILGSIVGVGLTYIKTKKDAPTIVAEAAKESGEAFQASKGLLEGIQNKIADLSKRGKATLTTLTSLNNASEPQLSALAEMIGEIESYMEEISKKISPAIDKEREIIKSSRYRILMTWSLNSIDKLGTLDIAIGEFGRSLSQPLVDLQQIANSLKQEQTRLQSNS